MKMGNLSFRQVITLACLAGIATAQSKTLLVLPLKIDTLQVKDYRSIREFYSEALGNVYGGQIKNAKNAEPCADKECAFEALKAESADEAVYGAVRMLGSKYFFNSSIISAGEAPFSQQIQVSNVEDFENGTKRMAEALCHRKSLEQVATVDNITEKEEDLQVNRRRSFYSTGASLGYTFPIGHSYDRWVTEPGNCSGIFPCPDKDVYHSYSQIIRLGWNNWFEFNDHLALEMDVLLYAPVAMGGDVNLEYLFGTSDFTPFAGGGVGLHYAFPDEGTHADENKRNSGPAANVQAGMILFRTYGMNLVVRGQYHIVANDDVDQGPAIDLAVRTKMGSSGDKYHHVSATTWLGAAIGVAYLIAIISGGFASN